MVNANKRKGDAAERIVCDALQKLGFPWAARVKAGAQKDTGDIHLVLGQLVTAQVKNVRSPRWVEWMESLQEQKTNANSDVAFLVWKPGGLGETKSHDWLAVVRLKDMAELLRRAGYGTEIDE